MVRARVAFLIGLASLFVAVASLAYLGYMMATRPLYSGITPEILVATVGLLAGTAVGQTFKILSRRWRTDYLGRAATVRGVYKNSIARVSVDGVPYLAFVKDPVRKGDQVILTSTKLEGAPPSVHFVAEKTADRPTYSGSPGT